MSLLGHGAALSTEFNIFHRLGTYLISKIIKMNQ